VADGVGGWSEVGVDSALFSRRLMHNAHKIAETEQEFEPYEILKVSIYYNDDNNKHHKTTHRLPTTTNLSINPTSNTTINTEILRTNHHEEGNDETFLVVF